MAEENKMRNIEIEKIVLNCGGVDEKLQKSIQLLKLISGKKIKEVESTKRIPTFGVRPGLKTGCMVTIRNKDKIQDLLPRFLEAIDNKLRKKQIAKNAFSFGIKEYLEIPGMEYQRDIGILGFEITVVFKRKGKRVAFKKIKQGRVPAKQGIPKEEIIEFIKSKFNVEIE
jgi:large subunit ribosomal protein L5